MVICEERRHVGKDRAIRESISVFVVTGEVHQRSRMSSVVFGVLQKGSQYGEMKFVWSGEHMQVRSG